MLADLEASWSSEWWLRRGRPKPRQSHPTEIRKGWALASNINTCDYNKQQSCETLEAATERAERRLKKATQEV